MSKWSEIRIDYIDEEDEFWRVDAWETDNENEEGKVIALIDNRDEHRIVYLNPLARVDEYVKEEISFFVGKLKNIEKEN